MRSPILVTGASGFVGSWVVRQLVDSGRPVRTLVRSLRSVPVPGVEVVLGDLTDRPALRRATKGVDTIIHLAACAKVSTRDPDEFERVNVQGTARLLEAAASAMVRRFVHVSTILTLPPFRPASRGEHRVTEYEVTKAAGERLVAAYRTAGHHAVIVHPTRIYGPGPLHDSNGATAAVAMYLSGRFRLRLADDDVQANYVHVEDVARGILLSAQHGLSGRHYVLGGENASFQQLLERVARIAGVRRAVWALPPSLAMIAGFLSECWGVAGGRPRISRAWIRSFLEDRRTDSSLATAELGYVPRDLDTGLRETIAWLRHEQERRAA